MECYHCHREVPAGANYCLHCGKKLTRSDRAKGSGIKIYNLILSACYFVTLLSCFICNLAIEHGLSWFYIVFFSILISFSITNLPFILPRYRIALPAISAITFLYFLLWVINRYAGGDWFFRLRFPSPALSYS